MKTTKNQNPKVEFLINLAYLAAIVALIILVLKYFVSAMLPIILAFALASIARPLSRFLSLEQRTVKRKGERVTVKRKLRLPKKAASIISVVVLLILAVGFVTFFVIELSDTVSDLLEQVPVFYNETIEPAFDRVYKNLMAYALTHKGTNVDTISDLIPNMINSIGSFVTTASAKAVTELASLATSLPSILLNVIICIIATVFIAIDYERIMEFIKRNLRSRALMLSMRICDSFLDIVWQFIKSYFIIFVITVTEIVVGLLIIGVDHPFLIAVLIGLFDAFPIVGSGMILLPWSVITMIIGDLPRGIGLFVVYATVVIVRQFIEPKIVGKRVGLRPIVTLTCMYAGTKIIGGIGLFALPITAAILVDLNDTGVISLFKKPGERSRSAEEADAIEDSEPEG